MAVRTLENGTHLELLAEVASINEELLGDTATNHARTTEAPTSSRANSIVGHLDDCHLPTISHAASGEKQGELCFSQ